MENMLLCFCMLFIANVNGISIQFFKDEYLTDLILESNSTAGCNNIRLNGLDFVEVFIKTDTCLMIYKDSNCQSKSSDKILPDSERDIRFWLESFHVCNINEGGSRLTLDITEYYDNKVPNVIQRFRNVCSCINVPNNVTQMDKWSINNHGNEIWAYFEPNCMQTKTAPQNIAAGNSHDSRTLPTNGNLKVQSFGPVEDSSYFRTSCNPDLRIMDKFIEDFSRLAEADVQFALAGQLQIDNGTGQIEHARIEFYARTKFRSFLFASDATEPCNNLPKRGDPDWVTNKIESIKTTKCVVVYANRDCKGLSSKIESPGISDVTLIFQFVKGTETKSFQLCNNIIGGLELNIDITEGVDYVASLSTFVPPVLQSYRDVCYCQQIPKFILNKMKWSINNYANSLIVYFEQDCKAESLKPLWIPAGNSKYSVGVGYYGQTEHITGIIQRVQSFGPDPDSQNFKTRCLMLESVIVKFEILEPDDGIESEENNEMIASKTVFQNNGPAEISQTYSIKKSVRESFQIDIGSSLSNMNRVQIDNTFDVETRKGSSNSASDISGTSRGWGTSHTKTTDNTKTWNVGGGASVNLFGLVKIGAKGGYTERTNVINEHTDTTSGSNSQVNERSNSKFQEDSFKHGLRKAYENSGTKSISGSFTATVENTTEFSVSQVIKVPHCSEHVVSAYVKMVTNKHVEYRALTKISGKIGDKVMTSAEVKKFMDSKLEYVGDYDNNTVLAYSKGSFRAEYGISSYISAEGNTLHDCMDRISSREKSCPKCECSMGSDKKAATSLAHPFMAYAGIF